MGASWALLGAPRAVVCCFSSVWEPLGRCWALPGLLHAVFRVFLYFLYFLRRRRAERRERSERCEAPGLLFAVFRYFLLFLFIFDCFVIVWAVFKSSALALHASTALICLRASRSLLRQVFLVGPGGVFFRVFFLHRLLMVFSWILEGFWRPKLLPKPVFGVFFAMLFWRASWNRFFGVFFSFF